MVILLWPNRFLYMLIIISTFLIINITSCLIVLYVLLAIFMKTTATSFRSTLSLLPIRNNLIGASFSGKWFKFLNFFINPGFRQITITCIRLWCLRLKIVLLVIWFPPGCPSIILPRVIHCRRRSLEFKSTSGFHDRWFL